MRTYVYNLNSVVYVRYICICSFLCLTFRSICNNVLNVFQYCLLLSYISHIFIFHLMIKPSVIEFYVNLEVCYVDKQ